jgi:hypothetical protein
MKRLVTENLNEFFRKATDNDEFVMLKKIEILCRKESAECERIIGEFEEGIPEEQTDDLEAYHEANGKLAIIAQIMDIMSID